MAGPIEQIGAPSQQVLSNAEIADRLAGLAQLLSAQKENPYKVKAYQRASARIRTFSESLDELVRDDADLTRFAGIGEAIASAIREIVLTGTLGKLEKLRAAAPPALASISDHPRLAVCPSPLADRQCGSSCVWLASRPSSDSAAAAAVRASGSMPCSSEAFFITRVST
jgi:hypothetical protein